MAGGLCGPMGGGDRGVPTVDGGDRLMVVVDGQPLGGRGGLTGDGTGRQLFRSVGQQCMMAGVGTMLRLIVVPNRCT